VLSGIRELIFDFSEVDYVSSAGLRVILLAQKKMASRGSMKLIHVAPEVMEVFEMTGFDAILSIE
ncbi:MAG: STAS domain-containing protein, partial [Victivallaceae bacterium]